MSNPWWRRDAVAFVDIALDLVYLLTVILAVSSSAENVDGGTAVWTTNIVFSSDILVYASVFLPIFHVSELAPSDRFFYVLNLTRPT